jgi:hypothetical protein
MPKPKPKPITKLKAGDIITPWPAYRWIPFGVLSLGLWGMLGFAPVMLFLIYLEKGEEVTRTFQGEGLRVWLICIGVWLAALAAAVGAGILLMRRRVIAEPDGVTLRGRFGTTRHYPGKGLVSSQTVYSIAALMQGVIHLRYADGKRRTLDGAGFSQIDLGRITHYLDRIREP